MKNAFKPLPILKMLNDHKAINELLKINVTLVLLHFAAFQLFATHMSEIFFEMLKKFEISSDVSLT